MLDYYFCEECETYHQPNRIINGEILSACECQISTQSNSKQSRDTCEADMLTTPINNVYVFKGNSTMPAQTGVRFQYQSPPRIQPAQTVRHVSKQMKKVNNFPFLTITKEQNQQPVRRFIVNSPSRQPHQPMSPKFAPPQQIKQELPMHKVAVNTRLNGLAPVKSPVVRLQQMAPSLQQMRPIIVMGRTPIQTVGQFTQIQLAEAPPETKLSIELPSQEEYSVKVIEPTPSFQMKERQVELDRVSGYTFADHDEVQQARISKNQRVSLDRVAAQTGAISESDQKQGCCTCYH